MTFCRWLSPCPFNQYYIKVLKCGGGDGDGSSSGGDGGGGGGGGG
jgi:hypothetical protein